MHRARLTPFAALLLALATLLGLLATPAPLRAQESVYDGIFVTSNLDSSLSHITQFEALTGKGVAIVHVFQGIDSTGNVFPTSRMQSIRARGSIPLLTLEPWLDLRQIAAGVHDELLTAWALGAKAWGHPFFFRYAHEMNSDWYPRWSVWPGNGNTAEDFVAAWRHVHHLFTRLGVTNATWVWCVNRFYDLPNGPSTRIAALYPGDRYVDWLSFDSYNRGTINGNTWRSFADASQPVYDELVRIAPGKPIMVAETGTVEEGGDKAQWFRTALKNHLKTRFPRIKAWVYFNLDKSGYDNRVQSTEASRAAYAESVGLSYYSTNRWANLSTSPIPPLYNDALTIDTDPPYVSFILPATDVVVPGRRTEVRFDANDKSGIDRIEVFVNGQHVHTERLAPYQYFWDVPTTHGAAHTIRLVAYDTAGNSASATHTVTARFEPAVYWGTFTTSALNSNFQSIRDFETAAGKQVSIINLFQHWSGTPSFPTSIANNIRNHGAIPLVTWEPWNSSGDATQPTFRLRAIADGAHDAYITSWATGARNWGHPFFLRFMHEMNGNWYPWCVGVNDNTPQDYVDAWRRVHRIFTEVGATNVTWVWCVNRHYAGSADITSVYPGDRYVDWTSLDCYNRGTAMPGNSWRTFHETFDATYQSLVQLAPGKPVMVAESGTVEQGGSKPGWFTEGLAHHLPFSFPRIKAFVWFNLDKNGFDNRITSTEASRAAFAAGIALPYYTSNTFGSLAASPIPPLLADASRSITDDQPPYLRFSRPLRPRVVPGQNTEIRVEAADRSGIDRVEFYVGDVLRHTATAEPYVWSFPVPATPGASHLVRAVAYDRAGNSAPATDTLVADLAPLPASVLWGASTVNGLLGPDLSSVDAFEAAAGRAVSIVHFSSAWHGSPAFPSGTMGAIRARGALPMITWEPRNPSAGAAQTAYRLRAIADGAHDAYITQWAAAAANWGHPFFLRFAHQMNGDWFPWSYSANGNTAQDYIDAWRRVHRLFAEAGAANVTWVWGVNRLFGGASNNIASAYPGDKYVDWLAMDGYNRGGAGWRDFATTFGATYQQLLAIASAKPVMIAETGTVEAGGDKAAWLRDALSQQLPLHYPRVRAFVYTEALRDGFANTITSGASARAAFAEAISSGYYGAGGFAFANTTPVPPLLADALPADTQAPFLTMPLPLGATVVAGQTNEIRVEYFDRSALDRIEIRIDGVLRQTERLHPYQFFWPVPSTPGVAYTITARAWDALGNNSTFTHLVTSVAPPHPVDAWRASRFTSAQLADPAISGDAADPDGDGLPNLLEYALGTDPLSPGSAGHPALSLTPSTPRSLRITFHRIASTGIRYEVQASSDLAAAWTTIWSSSGAQNVAGPVTVTDPADLSSHPRRFLRLRVSRE